MPTEKINNGQFLGDQNAESVFEAFNKVNRNNEVIDALESGLSKKTDSGGYLGNAQDLKDEIDNISFEGLKTYQTLSDLNLVTPIPQEGTSAKVANDTALENNGYYSVVGGEWIKDELFYDALLSGEDIVGKVVDDYNREPETIFTLVGRSDSSTSTVTAFSTNDSVYYNTVAEASMDGIVKNISIDFESNGTATFGIIEHDWEAGSGSFTFIKTLGTFSITAGINEISLNINISKGQKVCLMQTDTKVRRGGSDYIDNNRLIIAKSASSGSITVTNLDLGLAYSVTFEYIVISELKDLLDREYKRNEEAGILPIYYKESYLGNVDLLSLYNYDIIHFAQSGQSLSVGGETDEAITTTNINGNIMLGSNVLDRDGTSFNPLINVSKEDSVVPMTNVLSELIRRDLGVNAEFLATSSGASSQPISSFLSTGIAAYIFENHLTNSKAVADALGKTIGCPSITFIQGESDYTESKSGAVANEESTYEGRYNLYKARLIQLKNEMQDLVIATYGQTERPLFFVHSPQGAISSVQEMYVNMAQYDACQENEDMIYLGAPYFTPQYDQIHLSTNGYRWWGEMIAKYMYKTLVKKINSEPLNPKSFRLVGNNTIHIDFLVPNPPLVIDTHTVAEVANYGFHLYGDGSEVSIDSVSVIGSSSIRLTSLNDLTAFTKLVVHYGSMQDVNSQLGEGNICDSDKWVSKYLYVDDSSDVSADANTIPNRPKNKNGSEIFGQKYPMQNWLVPFSYEIKS